MSYALAAQAAIAAGQMIYAHYKKKNRPKYKIPEAVKQATALAHMRTQTNMPGFSQLNDRVALNTANSLEAGARSGDVTHSIASIAAGANKGYQDIGIANAQFHDRAISTFGRSAGNLGRYKDREWQINEFAPYAEGEQESRDIFGAGLQNMVGALDGYDMSQQGKLTNDINAETSSNVAQAGLAAAAKIRLSNTLESAGDRGTGQSSYMLNAYGQTGAGFGQQNPNGMDYDQMLQIIQMINSQPR